MDDEKIYNRVRRWMISTRDFEIAQSAATFLLDEVDERAGYAVADLRKFKCYETTMVVAYCRPFSMAKGAVGPLSEREAGLSATNPFYPLHCKLTKHRNTLYGHSDAEFVDMRVWNIDVDDAHSFPMPRFGEHLNFSMEEVMTIHTFISVAMSTLMRRTMKIGPQFKDRFISIPG